MCITRILHYDRRCALINTSVHGLAHDKLTDLLNGIPLAELKRLLNISDRMRLIAPLTLNKIDLHGHLLKLVCHKDLQRGPLRHLGEQRDLG